MNPYLGVDNSSFNEEDGHAFRSPSQRTDFEYETPEFYGRIEHDHEGAHGFFEHSVYGDEYGGGLWFDYEGEDVVLVDYDGISGYLPEEVCEELEKKGYNMSFGRDPE